MCRYSHVLVVCTMLSVLSATALASAPSLEYDVSIDDPTSKEVSVSATFSNLPQHQTLTLGMSTRYASAQPAKPLLSSPLRASCDAQEQLTIDRQSPYRWLLTTSGCTEIKLSYSVVLDHRQLANVRDKHDEYEHPYLARDHGMLVAGAIFVAPQLSSEPRVRVNLTVPRGWSVHSPWPSDSEYTFTPDTASLFDDIIPIGNWDTTTFRCLGTDVTTAYAPAAAWIKPLADPIIDSIIKQEMPLFAVTPRERYLFVFGEPGSSNTVYGGSPKQGSMTLTLSHDARPDELRRRLAILIAHEYFHVWHKSRFGSPSELRFFCEGFTDYYAHVLAVRAGLIQRDEFFQRANAILVQYLSAANGPHACSLVQAGGDQFFHKGVATRLVYNGGFLVAALTDFHIRQHSASRSLDDFMRAFINDDRWLNGSTPTLDDLFATMSLFVSPEVTNRIRTLVHSESSIDVVSAFRAVGITIEIVSKRRPVESIRANLNGTTVVNVDRRAASYHVGIRAGDVLKSVNGLVVESERDARSAWRQRTNERIRVTLERNGELLHIDEPIPIVTSHQFQAAPWPQLKNAPSHALPPGASSDR